jgi:heme/copper-type cytochrome/quinol oxidase subunit 2
LFVLLLFILLLSTIIVCLFIVYFFFVYLFSEKKNSNHSYPTFFSKLFALVPSCIWFFLYIDQKRFACII